MTVADSNFLAGMLSEEAANGLWAKTEPLTEDEVKALINRQRAIRAHLDNRAEGWEELE